MTPHGLPTRKQLLEGVEIPIWKSLNRHLVQVGGKYRDHTLFLQLVEHWEKDDPEDDDDEGLFACPQCEGDGILHGKDCALCGGSGEVDENTLEEYIIADNYGSFDEDEDDSEDPEDCDERCEVCKRFECLNPDHEQESCSCRLRVQLWPPVGGGSRIDVGFDPFKIMLKDPALVRYLNEIGDREEVG